jgi:hypothetical protein
MVRRSTKTSSSSEQHGCLSRIESYSRALTSSTGRTPRDSAPSEDNALPITVTISSLPEDLNPNGPYRPAQASGHDELATTMPARQHPAPRSDLSFNRVQYARPEASPRRALLRGIRALTLASSVTTSILLVPDRHAFGMVPWCVRSSRSPISPRSSRGPTYHLGGSRRRGPCSPGPARSRRRSTASASASRRVS